MPVHKPIKRIKELKNTQTDFGIYARRLNRDDVAENSQQAAEADL